MPYITPEWGCQEAPAGGSLVFLLDQLPWFLLETYGFQTMIRITSDLPSNTVQEREQSEIFKKLEKKTNPPSTWNSVSSKFISQK